MELAQSATRRALALDQGAATAETRQGRRARLRCIGYFVIDMSNDGTPHTSFAVFPAPAGDIYHYDTHDLTTFRDLCHTVKDLA